MLFFIIINLYEITKTTYPPGYHHNDFVAVVTLGNMMHIYIYIYIHYISTLTSLSLHHMLCSKTQLNNVDNNNVSVIKLSYASFYI